MREELLRYCIDACKVLLKAVLIFRNIIIDKTIKTITQEDGSTVEQKLDIDPFREAITIPSLACKITATISYQITQLKPTQIQRNINPK